MISNLLDVPPEENRAGMPAEVVLERRSEDLGLPLFRRTAPTSGRPSGRDRGG